MELFLGFSIIGFIVVVIIDITRQRRKGTGRQRFSNQK